MLRDSRNRRDTAESKRNKGILELKQRIVDGAVAVDGNQNRGRAVSLYLPEPGKRNFRHAPAKAWDGNEAQIAFPQHNIGKSLFGFDKSTSVFSQSHTLLMIPSTFLRLPWG